MSSSNVGKHWVLSSLPQQQSGWFSNSAAPSPSRHAVPTDDEYTCMLPVLCPITGGIRSWVNIRVPR